MRSKSWMLFAVIIIVALIAGMTAQSALNNARHLQKVVVVSKAVTPYDQITSSDVQVESRSLVNFGETYYTHLSDVIGKYAQYGLVPGEIVSSDGIAASNPLDSIQPGWHVATLSLNMNDFDSKDLHVGYYVDIQGVQQGQVASSVTLAQHVEIVKVITGSNSEPGKIQVLIPDQDKAAVTASAQNGNTRIVLDSRN